jgi:hypothetical protein
MFFIHMFFCPGIDLSQLMIYYLFKKFDMRRFCQTFSFISTIFFLISCNEEKQYQLSSPSGDLTINFMLSETGEPTYNVIHKNGSVIENSTLGFSFTDMPDLGSGIVIKKTEDRTVDEEWDMPWGEYQSVRSNFNELSIFCVEKSEPKRKVNIIFRAFDDGIGFRYEFPEQAGENDWKIKEENTEFKLTGDHMTWWIPGDWDIYEHLYNTTRFSEIDAISKRNHPNLAQTYIPHNAVNTPVTMKTDDGKYLSFHEAALMNYPGMTLGIPESGYTMKSILVGGREEHKASVSLPFSTPWRMILITESATDLISSTTILNLNKPNKLGDISWFKPMKYMGIWWEMHLGKSTWEITSGRHGATTENAKAFIDFAAKNNIGGVLVEGWNTGWDRWIGFEDREGVFDFVTPYPDYDIEEVVAYGKSKGVEIIMHHETSSAPRTYDQQLDTAYNLMKRLGIHGVKTGYVGPIIPKGEYHHGQWMVNHYQKTVEEAAKRQIAVNIHEPIKATGLRRTYPNMISREGLRGQEFNAWAKDGGNPPEHLTIVPFTRMLGGPIDFTPGIFHISLDPYKPENQINTTLSHQLALYVVIYSPIQMAADLIEYYDGHPAFQFIRDVPTDWSDSKVLQGEIADFVVIARKERDGENWYVGAITDENARELTLDFSFLDEGSKYKAVLYHDTEDAHYRRNPLGYNIENIDLTSTTQLNLKLAPGGGAALSIERVK